jgi:hypothetical protein
MGKFKMKGIKTLMSSPLRNESSVTWDPNKTLSNVREEKVDGGTNVISTFDQAGLKNSSFIDSGDKLSDEEYAKLKQDPAYIAKEEEYKNRLEAEKLNRQSTEVEFIKDPVDIPSEEKEYNLKKYYFGNAAGAISTGAYPDVEQAWKDLEISNKGSGFGELYVEDPNTGERTLVKDSGFTDMRIPTSVVDGKIVRGDKEELFEYKKPDNFPDYKNMQFGNETVGPLTTAHNLLKQKRKAREEEIRLSKQKI